MAIHCAFVRAIATHIALVTTLFALRNVYKNYDILFSPEDAIRYDRIVQETGLTEQEAR